MRPGRHAPTTNRLSAPGLPGALTLLAMIDGAVAGFASLKGADEIDMLFVDPEFARQGAGRALIDALARLAQARGAKRLTVEASELSAPSFCSSAQGLWLASTRRKLLDPRSD